MKYIKLLFTLLPVIQEAIIFAELLLKGTGRGEEKLKFVRELIEETIEADLGTTFDLSKLMDLIEIVVKKIVDKFNEVGWPTEEKDD